MIEGSRTMMSYNIYNTCLLQTQVLRVEQVDEPYIRLTQENLIKNFVQNCLSYILGFHSPCYYF